MSSSVQRSLSIRHLSAVRIGIVCVLTVASHSSARSQTTDARSVGGTRTPSLPEEPQPHRSEDEVTVRGTPLRFVRDQGMIWTSPLRLQPADLKWLVPLAAASAASVATDHHTMGSVVTHNASFNQANVNASNVVVGGLIAAPAGIYGFGYFGGDAHAREAGLLGGEAILDGLVIEQGLKLIAWRERPAKDNARGLFFQSGAGVDSSFPSSHSVVAWSSAAVIAGEYPSPWIRLGVYSLATGVSVTRVLGQQHFPSDVLIGSAAGWLIGNYVYRTHHRYRAP